MKPLHNDIVLRPRFQLELLNAKEKVLESFEKSQAPPFLVKRIDEHIFIKFNKTNNHFWSPQLHLEMDEMDERNTKLYGVFGPNPTLWTFFMFLHFGLATLFVILGVWAYSKATLDKPYHLQIGLMGFTVVIWLVLYFFGRMGKKQGKPQMEALYGFMMDVLIDNK